LRGKNRWVLCPLLKKTGKYQGGKKSSVDTKNVVLEDQTISYYTRLASKGIGKKGEHLSFLEVPRKRHRGGKIKTKSLITRNHEKRKRSKSPAASFFGGDKKTRSLD